MALYGILMPNLCWLDCEMMAGIRLLRWVDGGIYLEGS